MEEYWGDHIVSKGNRRGINRCQQRLEEGGGRAKEKSSLPTNCSKGENLEYNQEPYSARDQVNPSTPVNNQDRISPYNIDTKSRRQLMRTKKSIY